MAVSTEERRIVTVLFADIADSTALGEQLDPEEMRSVLARYYAIARECVETHGGTVEKFIGDAVMAVFGLPTAHGYDPDRAVAAALTIRDRIQEDLRLRDRVAIRFGVSTGEVVASRDQSAGDFLITGDATNVAARLQQAAEPWGILASDRTVRAANNFEFGEQIDVRARGKSAPVAAHLVIGPRKAKTRSRERLPLVGRENDLAQIQLVARRAGTEGVDKDLLFAAWRSAIEATARRNPLVIVFEDLHWSSDSLLDLAEFVMQPRGDAAVLMIVLARPELLDRRPNWGGGRLNHLALALEPLGSRAIGELVRHLLDTDEPDVINLVAERSEGNPFYAGELVRSYLEHGSLERLPDTVQATVLARLDLLPPDERRVIQLGSVFGRAFRASGVAALEGGEARHVQQLCEDLADRDLIRPAEGDRYSFRHILIQEVAYGTLPRSERARLHAEAARWVESNAGQREVALAEILAFHYREAAVLYTALEPGSELTAL